MPQKLRHKIRCNKRNQLLKKQNNTSKNKENWGSKSFLKNGFEKNFNFV